VSPSKIVVTIKRAVRIGPFRARGDDSGIVVASAFLPFGAFGYFAVAGFVARGQWVAGLAGVHP
jgi:hypothetical protein